MPKARLKADHDLHFEYVLAKELKMTHRQLMRSLAPGELAFWHATFALERQYMDQARADAARKAESERKSREVLSGRRSNPSDQRKS